MDNQEAQGSPFPQGIFKAAEYRNGSGKPSPFATHAASEYIVRQAIATFQLPSSYKLAKLLNVPHANNGAQWLDGTSRMRTRYMARLVTLCNLFVNGIVKDFRLIDRVDWETAEIVYRSGVRGKLPGQRDSLDRFREQEPPFSKGAA